MLFRSHDMRNPLSAIKTAASLLARDNPDMRQIRLIRYIQESTDRAKRLISQLLDFTLARVGQGISISKAEIDFHNTISHALAELRLAFPNSSWTHEVIGIGTCLADPDRLVQVLGNLVANAVAYGAPSEPLTVRTIVDEAAVTLEVHNQGSPISPGMLASIFEPMTRGHATDSGMRSVGLGLYIVKEIVQAHAGRVGVTSTADDGTTFTASFPRR